MVIQVNEDALSARNPSHTGFQEINDDVCFTRCMFAKCGYYCAGQHEPGDSNPTNKVSITGKSVTKLDRISRLATLACLRRNTPFFFTCLGFVFPHDWWKFNTGTPKAASTDSSTPRHCRSSPGRVGEKRLAEWAKIRASCRRNHRLSSTVTAPRTPSITDGLSRTKCVRRAAVCALSASRAQIKNLHLHVRLRSVA